MEPKFDKQTEAACEVWWNSFQTGPVRTRWTESPLQVGDAAPGFELPDASGELVSLDSFWQENPALILFWRHYGCGCGLDRSARLNDEMADYEKAGANVLIIGQGEPERAWAYAEKYDLPPVPILSDKEEKVYEAYGLLEGKPSQILFDAPEEYQDLDHDAGRGLMAERREMGRPLVDNPWLLPGEFVVDQQGVIRLAYRYNYCEDFPDPRVHVAAIREARISR